MSPLMPEYPHQRPNSWRPPGPCHAVECAGGRVIIACCARAAGYSSARSSAAQTNWRVGAAHFRHPRWGVAEVDFMYESSFCAYWGVRLLAAADCSVLLPCCDYSEAGRGFSKWCDHFQAFLRSGRMAAYMT